MIHDDEGHLVPGRDPDQIAHEGRDPTAGHAAVADSIDLDGPAAWLGEWAGGFEEETR